MPKLISTGGTIACLQTEKGLRPALGAGELLREAGVDADSAQDLFFMDSSNVQPEEWIDIAAAILASPDKSIVVTHGTDTMAYTASMLSFLLMGGDRTVVLTGSQKPIGERGSDAADNLRGALLASEFAPPGVYVYFGGMLMLGVRAVKTRTTSYDAFESINYPCIARLQGNSFVSTAPLPRRRDVPGFVRIDGNVALIKLIPGLPVAVIDNILRSELKGVVVEGFGLGGMHNSRRDHSKSVHTLISAGIPVVMKSQCLYEAASVEVYEVSRSLCEMGVITVGDMTTEAAVTKLMWALAYTHDIDGVRDIMTGNYCGELAV